MHYCLVFVENVSNIPHIELGTLTSNKIDLVNYITTLIHNRFF